jgi:hypothetical protein
VQQASVGRLLLRGLSATSRNRFSVELSLWGFEFSSWKARHRDMPDLLLGLGEALGGLLDILLSKHKLVPAVQSSSLVVICGKRFCR